MNCDKPDYWEQRYRAGRIPWDMGGVPPMLYQFLRQAPPGGGRVLIPGCGSGYEVRAFAEHGWDVVAIDFSPAAVERARNVLGDVGRFILKADFFRDSQGGEFDLIYERTFLCSLPPERWPEYATRVAELLRPDGRLAGVFFYGDEPEPPPFPLSPDSAASLLGRRFVLTEDRPIPAEQSLPLYAGAERWQVWARRRTGAPC